MSYKVTISNGIVLENCINNVSLSVDTFNDYNSITAPRNSMIITGKIDTDEKTSGLYQWALLSGATPECYKEITVEQYHKNLLLRKVHFSKAFVIDYTESYSNHVGIGTFTLYVRQFLDKDIEVTSDETNTASNKLSEVTDKIKGPVETVQRTVAVIDSPPNSRSTKNPSMSFTDRVAKNNVLKDNAVLNKTNVPPAFRQTEFATTYEARIAQTPTETNLKVGFQAVRGESLCTLKPPPDTELKKILDEAGINGIEYRNAIPDFLPTTKAQVEIDHMLGGTGKKGTDARRANFAQANKKLADKLNKSPELADQFGLTSGNITPSEIEKFRVDNDLTWHELNDCKTMQLVPSKINGTFGHTGGVGEINAGAFKPGGFAKK